LSRRSLRRLYEIVETLILAVIIFLTLHTFVAQPHCIRQESMEHAHPGPGGSREVNNVIQDVFRVLPRGIPQILTCTLAAHHHAPFEVALGSGWLSGRSLRWPSAPPSFWSGSRCPSYAG